jgi:hypothetical protein
MAETPRPERPARVCAYCASAIRITRERERLVFFVCDVVTSSMAASEERRTRPASRMWRDADAGEVPGSLAGCKKAVASPMR